MNRQREAGFTLVELMVVVVILGLLLGIVGLNIVNVQERSTRKIAQAQMARIGDAVEIYHVEKLRLPESLRALTEPDRAGNVFMEIIPRDPWDGEYGYEKLTKRKYQIRCLGEDGLPGTDDDLTHPVLLRER